MPDKEAMTKEEAMAAVLAAQANNNTEMAHIDADSALCAFLRHLGHGDLADAYEDVFKWYA